MHYVPHLDMYIPVMLDEITDGVVVTKDTGHYRFPSNYNKVEYIQNFDAPLFAVETNSPSPADPLFNWRYDTLDFLRTNPTELAVWEGLTAHDQLMFIMIRHHKEAVKSGFRSFTVNDASLSTHDKNNRAHILNTTHKLTMLSVIAKGANEVHCPFPINETEQYIKRPYAICLSESTKSPFVLSAGRKKTPTGYLAHNCKIDAAYTTAPLWMPSSISSALHRDQIKKTLGITHHCRTPEEAIKLAIELNIQIFKQCVAYIVKPELRDLVYNKPFQI